MSVHFSFSHKGEKRIFLCIFIRSDGRKMCFKQWRNKEIIFRHEPGKKQIRSWHYSGGLVTFFFFLFSAYQHSTTQHTGSTGRRAALDALLKPWTKNIKEMQTAESALPDELLIYSVNIVSIPFTQSKLLSEAW